ncbi:MAG: hypothetical protein EAX96_10520 [Candidatus Lokiarchaeota archaeon]|nr:hypothetical protein [Candidatus Lokiarchaeota archaeon]
MKTSWEKREGKKINYLDVTRTEVVVGHHYGGGMSDIAGSCSHKEFLEGRFQNLILERFGEAVLKEALRAVKKASIYPPFLMQKKEIKQRLEFLEAISLDETLKKKYCEPDLINGFSNYGNQGQYKTLIKSDSVTLFYEGARGYVQKISQQQVPIELPGHASAVIELNDYFYIVVDQNLVVLNPEGQIVYNSTQEHIKENIHVSIFGSYLRINNIFRWGETVFISYWWFNREFNDGLLKFELGKGFTRRYEIINK